MKKSIFFFLTFLSVNLFIIPVFVSSLTFESDYINSESSYSFNLNPDNSYNALYVPDKFLNFASYSDNIDYNNYFTNVSTALVSYFNFQFQTANVNRTLKGLNFIPETSKTAKITTYTGNGTLTDVISRGFEYSISLVIPDSTPNFSIFDIILNSNDDDYALRFQKFNDNYKIGIVSTLVDNSTFEFDESIDKSYIENKYIMIEIESAIWDATHIYTQMSVEYSIGNENEDLTDFKFYETNIDIEFNQIDFLFNSTCEIFGIDSTAYLSFNSEIKNHLEYTMLNWKRYNDKDFYGAAIFNKINQFQPLLNPRYGTDYNINYTKFTRFSDNITNYEYTNASYLANNPYYLENNIGWVDFDSFEYFDYVESNIECKRYNDNFLNDAMGIIYAFDSDVDGLGTIIHHFSETLTTLDLQFYLYVNSNNNDYRYVVFENYGGTNVCSLRLDGEDLWYAGSTGTYMLNSNVFPISDYYFFNIHIDTTEEEFIVKIDGTEEVNTDTTSTDLEQFKFDIDDSAIFYVGKISYTSDVYDLNFITWDDSRENIVEALEIPLQNNEQVSFYTPNPTQVWGFYNSFYFACDFEYENNLEYIIDFDNIKYKLFLNFTHLTVQLLNNSQIIDSFYYERIDNLINQNVRFIVDYRANMNVNTQFTLILDKYILAINEEFSSNNQPYKNCQSCYFKANDNLDLVLINMYTRDWTDPSINLAIINNEQKKTDSSVLLTEYTITLPNFNVDDDYEIYSGYFIDCAISQNANTSNVLSVFTFENTPLSDYNYAEGNYDWTFDFNNTFQPSYLNIKIYSSESVSIEQTFQLTSYVIYYLKISDVFNIFLSFIPTVLIFFIFPVILYPIFKKWGVIIGIFISIIILSVINNFDIVQTLMLESIIILFAIYVFKQKRSELNDF